MNQPIDQAMNKSINDLPLLKYFDFGSSLDVITKIPCSLTHLNAHDFNEEVEKLKNLEYLRIMYFTRRMSIDFLKYFSNLKQLHINQFLSDSSEDLENLISHIFKQKMVLRGDL